MKSKNSDHKRRIRQSPKLPAETRREQLLQAAHDLFLQKGYRATGTEEIARAAGLTKGALYFHFKSKEDILLALVRRVLNAYAEAVEQLRGARLTPAGMLRELRRIDRDMPMTEARGNMGLLSEIMQIPRLRNFVQEGIRHSVDVLADCLDPTYGRTRARRRQIVLLTHALYDGLNMACFLHSELVKFDEVTHTYASLFPIGKCLGGRKGT